MTMLMARARSKALAAEASEASKLKGLVLSWGTAAPRAFAMGFVSEQYESRELTFTVARWYLYFQRQSCQNVKGCSRGVKGAEV